jgi:uncharacterized repeat protein (TIGR01451 family)
LTAGSSLGDWRVILFEPFGGSVQAVTSFTVIDAANPTADVSVSKGAISGSASNASQVVFSVQVSNSGPSAASAVVLSDTLPLNTSFSSFVQLDGPTFTCTNPAASATTGTSVCTIASLNRGESATFLATYNVAGASSGSVISNTASVTTTTFEAPNPNGDNNTSTSEVPVAATACQLSVPANIIVPADTGAAGALVTYTTPTGTGDCGQPTTGEGGEIIPPISCNPASGSFFPVGTSTVICSAQTGAAISFQVTVNNPGGLSISLNGANPVSVECGADFNDPGASAVNGIGQSVPVTVAYPLGFNPDAPAVGTYTATYTATEGANSVSTTRTINVSDNEPPSITVHGANPYKIQQGSCSPFVDPGASANDGCAGAKPVSSSISGPGGATSVNPATPGTYTVTYTATDGTHQATATRTVLVGNFPQDEVDQPTSANVPPTITLTCPTGVGDCSQTTIECGDTFTDLGATAAACGSSVPVTTSGSVDRHTPGIYSLTYTATANGLTSTATRTVTVGPDNSPPTITLNGADPIYVECHTGTFTDPGATADDACAGPLLPTASGSVNVDVVGPYTITYDATDPSGHAATPVTRTVIVRDTTPPTVTAPGPVTVYTGAGATACNATVSDAVLGAASANDACQGSVATSRSGVPAGNVFPVGQTTVTYSATDAYNNTGTATQVVTVVDNTPPVITLTGANPQVVECHTSYSDLGATANDACSGSLAVTSTNNVNINVPGSYTFTYSATDGASNTQTATRTVNVVDTIAPTTQFNNLTIFLNNWTIVFNTNSFTVNGTTYPFNGVSCTHEGYTFTFNGQTVTVSNNGYSVSYTFSGNTLVLWSPTHQYQTVKVADLIASAADSCDGGVDRNAIVISQATSDEPDDIVGGSDGNTIHDIVIAPDCKSVQLRAERDGSGNGRVYTITMRVRDAAGNTTTVTSKLKIFANSFNVVDDGPHNTVNGTCP